MAGQRVDTRAAQGEQTSHPLGGKNTVFVPRLSKQGQPSLPTTEAFWLAWFYGSELGPSAIDEGRRVSRTHLP